MPLSVCRCCGGKIPPEQLRPGPNPNICPSCERLLEEESPTAKAIVHGKFFAVPEVVLNREFDVTLETLRL